MMMRRPVTVSAFGVLALCIVSAIAQSPVYAATLCCDPLNHPSNPPKDVHCTPALCYGLKDGIDDSAVGGCRGVVINGTKECVVNHYRENHVHGLWYFDKPDHSWRAHTAACSYFGSRLCGQPKDCVQYEYRWWWFFSKVAVGSTGCNGSGGGCFARIVADGSPTGCPCDGTCNGNICFCLKGHSMAHACWQSGGWQSSTCHCTAPDNGP
jgi:hypothetical protein